MDQPDQALQRPSAPAATGGLPWGWLALPALALVLVLAALPWLLRGPAVPGPRLPADGTVTTAGVTGIRIALGAIQRADGREMPPDAPLADPNEVCRCLGDARLQFPNGSTVALQGATFQAFPGGLVLKQGRVEAEVPKKGLVFSVTTPVAVIGVRGTRFTVEVAGDGATAVAVAEGVVSVTTSRNEEYPLTAGRAATVAADGAWQAGPGGEPAPPPATASGPASPPATGVGSGSDAGSLLHE